MQSLPSDRLAAALLLAAIAGCVDAVGFSELGGYFVSFMSGNTTRIGLHIAYGEYGYALFALGLVVLFVGGAAAGTLIAERAGRRTLGVVMLVEAALLAGASLLLDGARPLAGAVLLPVAMGLANVVIFNGAGSRIGLTYMTGTLVRIGSGLATIGRGTSPRAVLLDVLLWVALVSGVVIGGIGRFRYGGEVLLAPVAALVAVGLADLMFTHRAMRKATVSVPPSGGR